MKASNIMGLAVAVLIFILLTSPCSVAKAVKSVKSKLACICPYFRDPVARGGEKRETPRHRPAEMAASRPVVADTTQSFEETAGNYQQSIVDGLEPEVLEGQKKYVSKYDVKRDPGATSRMITRAVVFEPVTSDFSGLRRPTAVKNSIGGGFQDLDIPEGALAEKTYRYGQ